MDRVVDGTLMDGHVAVEKSDPGLVLYQRGFGALARERIRLSLYEAAYLHERGKLAVRDARGKALDHERIMRAGRALEKQFRVKYLVFSDLRTRGYIVKTALKFGADFRVYDKGVRPGDDHAKWIVYPVAESQSHTWHDFAAKNRVAHSTRKKLLIAVVDDEEDITYFEMAWTRP